MPIPSMIRLARPTHWIKNIVVFMPIVFSMRIYEVRAWGRVGQSALAFCFASAFAYILNDIKDRNDDRTHPLKKHRPLASGRVSIGVAVTEAVVFLLIAVVVAWSLSRLLLLTVAVYVALQVSYTLFLKKKVLVDVICIALGFVLRAFSGVVAIREEISPWLFICVFTICLFMGFCKRYNEMITIGNAAQAKNHRPTLVEYTHDILMHIITLSAGIAILSFLLYSLSESTIERFGNDYFVYTLPLVIYVVFRFAMLSMKGRYSDPTDLILHDRPFQIITAVWVVAALGIIYWGSHLDGWIKNFY